MSRDATVRGKKPRPNLAYRALYASVATDEACWEWAGPRQPAGYGVVVVNGVHLAAHRWTYSLFSGQDIPSGMVACHRCDNPPCVNPAHIFVGTSRDNTHDMIRKGRGRNPLFEQMRAKTHCAQGHEFTPENTRIKRKRRGTGTQSYRACRICMTRGEIRRRKQREAESN